MMKKIKRLLQNDYIFSLAQKGLNIVTGIITVSLINRYLGTTLKGQYEYLLNIVNILNIILGFGLYASYPYMKRNQMDNQLKIYLNIFTTQILLYVSVAIIISILFRDIAVALASFLVVVRVMNTHLQHIGVVEFIRFRQIQQIISYLVEMILTIVVYIFVPQNMYILLIVLLVKHTIYIVAYMIKCRYIPNPFKFDLKFVKFMFKFGCIAMLTTLLMEFNYSIDVIIMRVFLPYSEIGLYSVGSKLAQYIWLIPDSFKEVLFSRTARSDSVKEIAFVLRFNIFVTILMILLMSIFGKSIITILYGVQYLDAYIVTIIIFLGIPSMVVYKIISPLYTANGKQKKCMTILFIGVAVNVSLNLIMIPQFGKIGAAISTVFSYSVCGLFLLHDFIRTYHENWKDCLIINKSDISKLIYMLKRKES